MRLGCCISSADELPPLAAAGADYCELPLARMVMGVGEAELEVLAGALSNAVPAFACNVFLPAEMQVVGPAVDGDALDRYVSDAMERVQRLGVRLLVFGSGRSRTVPHGFGRERALGQLADFLDATGSRCEGLGIPLVLEPLARAESNLITSVAEGAAFLHRYTPRGTHLLADLHHMMEEEEDLAVLESCGGLLVHAHVADGGRRAPGHGGYPIAEFLRRLVRGGYEGACSIECRWEDFASEIPSALTFLRQQAAGVVA